MPTYDYKCEKCGHEFEEMLPISRRNEPAEVPCERQLHRAAPICDGEVKMKVAAAGFAYDNISSPGHKKSSPSWMKDKLKEIKRQQPKATMNIPE
jgi:putative FmdB family regulatory protein